MPSLNKEKWSATIFAHNEASNIIRCLESVLSQSDEASFPIYVLANGCTDNTAQVVKSMTLEHPSIQLIVINKPDKANAWNQYTHHIAPESDYLFL
jgi:glycosyltransferase involved in cell wall biosynthesis